MITGRTAVCSGSKIFGKSDILCNADLCYVSVFIGIFLNAVNYFVTYNSLVFIRLGHFIYTVLFGK